MTTKKKQSAIDLAKETIGTGIVTSLGTYGFSRVGAAHPATAPAANAAVAGLQLAQVGQLAKVGMHIPKMMEGESQQSEMKVTKKKTTGDDKIDMMLGY